MSFTIDDLIEDNQTLVSVKPNDSAQLALDLMIEHNYSQLPVVDDDGRPFGIVTSASILRALSNFGVTIDALHVSSAVVKVHRFRSSDDLFDLLDDLQDNYAALIVDGNGRLTGIVTNYDTAEYFRRRAEDIMLVEDIETAIKEHIQAAFTTSSNEIDQIALASAIEDVTDPKQAKYRLASSAINHYLVLQGTPNATPNKKWVEEAVARIDEKKPVKTLDDLTFAEYTSLLFHKNHWGTYGKNFDLDAKALQKLLNDVRDTRNILAHFRSELTSQQRDQLRFCDDWFERHPPAIPLSLIAEDAAHLSEKATLVVHEPQTSYVVGTSIEPTLTPTDEELLPNASRYAPLAILLQGTSPSIDRLPLSFEEVEAIIRSPLPSSARRHRAWWANDSTAHIHSQLWLDAGWRVAAINMTEETVTFARIREREKAYIDFFNLLLKDFRTQAVFRVRENSPQGQSWNSVYSLPEAGPQLALFVFAFALGSKFRVELYIDTADQVKNKQLFDSLFADKAQIESTFGGALSWERLEEKRACRIAMYRPGAITDEPEKLAEIRSWAMDAMNRFYGAIAEKTNQALKAVLQRTT